MLFELGGKRKRLIQAIYVCLALLMFALTFYAALLYVGG